MDEEVVIIHNGSSTIRAGIGGDGTLFSLLSMLIMFILCLFIIYALDAP